MRIVVTGEPELHRGGDPEGASGDGHLQDPLSARLAQGRPGSRARHRGHSQVSSPARCFFNELVLCSL